MRIPVSCREREAEFLDEEESMQVSSTGHGQRSATQWREIIARYRQSGLGSRQFCEAEGLVRRTFEKGERRLRRKEMTPGQFVEIGYWGVTEQKPRLRDYILRLFWTEIRHLGKELQKTSQK
jgi:hypothetical protein